MKSTRTSGIVVSSPRESRVAAPASLAGDTNESRTCGQPRTHRRHMSDSPLRRRRVCGQLEDDRAHGAGCGGPLPGVAPAQVATDGTLAARIEGDRPLAVERTRAG